MGVSEHQTGGNRAYKQIGGIVYQYYSKDKLEAKNLQVELEKKAKTYNALKPPRLFSKCGRLVCLRVRKYKKTNQATFQLQFSKDGKQLKTEYKLGERFEPTWNVLIKLWREYFGLSVLDFIDYKEQIIKAKRLYMQDIYNIENSP
jgi:hypothetical protein